jgi:hypothetical protein
MLDMRQIASLAQKATDSDACAKAATLEKCDSVERVIDAWADGSRKTTVRLSFYPGESGVIVEQSFGPHTNAHFINLWRDNLPRLIQALLAAQLATETLNTVAKSLPESEEGKA